MAVPRGSRRDNNLQELGNLLLRAFEKNNEIKQFQSAKIEKASYEDKIMQLAGEAKESSNFDPLKQYIKYLDEEMLRYEIQDSRILAEGYIVSLANLENTDEQQRKYLQECKAELSKISETDYTRATLEKLNNYVASLNLKVIAKMSEMKPQEDIEDKTEFPFDDLEEKTGLSSDDESIINDYIKNIRRHASNDIPTDKHSGSVVTALDPNKKTICITGTNCPDGMGDIVHMLNVGSSLEKILPDYNIVYYIQWAHMTIESLKILMNFLKKYNIISYDINIEADTFLEYFKSINAINPAKFSIFPMKMPSLSDRKKTENIDHFVVVSTELRINKASQRPLIFHDKRVLYLNEHGSECPKKSDYDIFYSMGFSDGTGILLENNTEISEKDRVLALLEIENFKFRNLFFGEQPPESKNAKELFKIIKNTLFIPTHFRDLGIVPLKRILNAIAGCLPEDKRNVFLQGRFFKSEQFLDESIQSQLRNMGFTKIEYLNAENDNITIIELANSSPEKVLKVLNAYCNLHDYDLLNKKLCETFIGCAGDNAFQDAISRGAIPIFFPFHQMKINFLQELKSLLEKVMLENGKDWSSCIKFLDSYATKTEPVFTPDLINQWKEVCLYLIHEHNMHDKLFNIMHHFTSLPELNTDNFVTFISNMLASRYTDDEEREIICDIIKDITTAKETFHFFDIIMLENNLDIFLKNPILVTVLPDLFARFRQHLDAAQKELLSRKLEKQHEDLRNILFLPHTASNEQKFSATISPHVQNCIFTPTTAESKTRLNPSSPTQTGTKPRKDSKN